LEGAGAGAGVNCDGEDIQIKLFSNPAFQAKLKKLLMHTDKPSGSTTEVTQPCDQELFKTKNNILPTVSDEAAREDTKRFNSSRYLCPTSKQI